MQVVSIDSLLKSSSACSSSSNFVSESPSGQSAHSLNVRQPVFGHDVVQDIRGKRNREQKGAQTGGSSKKLKADGRTIKVLPQCLTIVGRLQLCNRSVHSWNGLYVPADCVALADSTATICCCICEGPDPRFLGKIVRVNSWSFIPNKGILMTNMSNAGDMCVEPHAKTGSSTASIAQTCPNYPAFNVDLARKPSFGSENLDCKQGILEIHSLEVMEAQPSQVTTLPSLFVSPAVLDSRKILVESPLTLQETKERGVILRGLPCSISPPFILPCKLSPDPSASPRRAGTGRMRDKAEQSNGKLPQEPMLGFIVAVQLCLSCNSTYIDSWKQVVKSERHRPRQVDERGQSAGGPGDFSASLKRKQVVTRVEQDSVSENFSFLPTPAVAESTPSSTKGFKPGSSVAHVYFSGSAAAWRPILSGALGRCVTVTGLRKKLILVGREKKPYSIFLATRKSSVTLDCGRELPGGRLKNRPGAKDLASTYPLKAPNLEPNATNMRSGNVTIDVGNCSKMKIKIGEEFGSTFDPSGRGREDAHVCMEVAEGAGKKVISFIGVVTDILFQGALIELDERVWLLLTHQRHTKLQGLRIGAMLSLRDTHAITMKDFVGKSLLLGACMHSHVSVVLFSSLVAQSWIYVHSKSLLHKYIQNLSFTSTFWLLSLIGSFRQKFRDIYSSKELLGAKKDPGIIQKYAEKMMAPDVTLERDVFKEIFFHQQFCQLGDNLPSISIMQVPPISNFCEHIEAIWQNPGSAVMFSKSKFTMHGQRRWAERRSPTSKSSSTVQCRQLIITSEELGITLLGSLQVCTTSGKLQLRDATGIVDVMIPDLSSCEHLSRTYQVSRFTVVVEGHGGAASPPVSKGVAASSISWSSLLKEVKAKPTFSKFVKYYVHFFIRDATHLHDLDWCKNCSHQRVPPPYCEKNSSWLQKQMHERWSKTKSHLDSLRAWFELQAVAAPAVCNNGHVMEILSECIGPSACSNRLFKVSCKVVLVKLLMFEWQGHPSVSELTVAEPHSWPWATCSTTSWKSPSGIPLALACFVVDDGSGPADCWALGDAAVSLLGLAKMASQLKLPAAVLERICMDRATSSDLKYLMEPSIEQTLCYMVQRYGRIILQNQSARGDSSGCHYMICGDGGKTLSDDEETFLHMVVASACHNGPLVVVGGITPSMEKVCSTVCKKATGSCEVHSRGHTTTSLEHSGAQLFAHSVESPLCPTDLKSISEQVARLLESKKADLSHGTLG